MRVPGLAPRRRRDKPGGRAPAVSRLAAAACGRRSLVRTPPDGADRGRRRRNRTRRPRTTRRRRSHAHHCRALAYRQAQARTGSNVGRMRGAPRVGAALGHRGRRVPLCCSHEADHRGTGYVPLGDPTKVPRIRFSCHRIIRRSERRFNRSHNPKVGRSKLGERNGTTAEWDRLQSGRRRRTALWFYGIVVLTAWPRRNHLFASRRCRIKRNRVGLGGRSTSRQFRCTSRPLTRRPTSRSGEACCAEAGVLVPTQNCRCKSP